MSFTRYTGFTHHHTVLRVFWIWLFIIPSEFYTFMLLIGSLLFQFKELPLASLVRQVYCTHIILWQSLNKNSKIFSGFQSLQSLVLYLTLILFISADYLWDVSGGLSHEYNFRQMKLWYQKINNINLLISINLLININLY